MARYDLHFQALTAAEQGFSTKIFTLGYEESLGVKGFQMLINMWVKTFFTRRGSDPTNLERGTAFANLIGSSTALSEAEDILRISIEECNEQVRAMQQNDTSLAAKERLATAKLLSYAEDPAGPGFVAYIEILNEAGERITLNIPDYAHATG